MDTTCFDTYIYLFGGIQHVLIHIYIIKIYRNQACLLYPSSASVTLVFDVCDPKLKYTDKMNILKLA